MDPEIADQVLRHVSGARWFAGKGRRAEIGGVAVLPWLTEVSQWPAVRVEIVRVDYPPEEDPDPTGDDLPAWPYELYQLVVAYHRAPLPDLQHAEIGRRTVADLGPTVAYDATQDPAALALIWRLLLAGADFDDRDAQISFHRADVSGLDPDATPVPFTGQQSNTSVLIGDQAMIKFFRRIELGPNLDIEVHAALAEAGVHDVARLYGSARGRWVQDGGPVEADLAMAVERLADAEDGWELALASLRADGDFADDPSRHGFAEDAAQLGTALAEIHGALRDAFPTSVVDGTATEAVMNTRLAAATQVVPMLAEVAPGLRAAFAQAGHGELATQRVHGDFHLGQTLKTPHGWKIIDFEGEPAKTMAERRAPDSPWRDVAGMLRSFDYGAATVPGPGAARWLASARKAFLTAYARGPLSLREQAVLRAYEADKAVYELVYEVRNRPDWTAIPLGAIRTLAQNPLTDGHNPLTDDQSTEGEHDDIRPRR